MFLCWQFFSSIHWNRIKKEDNRKRKIISGNISIMSISFPLGILYMEEFHCPTDPLLKYKAAYLEDLCCKLLTRPRSISFVVMTITCEFSWYTIFQKSTTVFCRHPWVAMKTLPSSTKRPSSCILYGWTAWMIIMQLWSHEDESLACYQINVLQIPRILIITTIFFYNAFVDTPSYLMLNTLTLI